MNLPTVIQKMKEKLYCCYRHFVQGKQRNDQTHCYSHVQLGIILPEQPVSKQIKRQLTLKKTLKANQQLILRQSQKPLEINGKSIALKNYGFDITMKDKAKKSLPEHLYSPFVYVDKVFPKDTKTRPLEHNNNFLITAENTCHRHLKYDLEIQQKISKMNKEERRIFFERMFNLTENLYYFYSSIANCLQQKKYTDKISIQIQDEDQPSVNILKKIFKKYAQDRKINLSTRHELMMINQTQFKDFIKNLGFQDQGLLDEFWITIFKEKIFEDYQIQEKPKVPGIASKRNSNIISMKAFFYNYNKFYEKKQKYKCVFSTNMLKQRNTDIRYAIYPWKAQYFAFKIHLKETKKLEFEICQKLSELGEKYSQDFSKLLQERNLLCFRNRTLSKMLYPLLCAQILDYDNVHQAFLDRMDKIIASMNEFESFLNAFKQHRKQIASRVENFNEEPCKATHLADFLAYSNFESSKAEIIIKWINKLYKYFYFFKEEEDIDMDYQKKKPIVKKDILFTYDEITEFLHYKKCKMQDQQKILNQYLLKLEEFYQANVNQSAAGFNLTTKPVFSKNMVAEFTLRYLKINLLSFEKINAIIKIIYPYLGQGHIPEQIVHYIDDIFKKSQPSPYFTTDHLFASEFYVQSTSCESCTDQQEQTWRDKINKKLKIFQNEAYALQHILVDWRGIKREYVDHNLKYPNVKIVKEQSVQIEEEQPPQGYKLVQDKNVNPVKDFSIRYLQIPKQKIYKVNVTKHNHPLKKSIHSARSIIFQQQKIEQQQNEVKNEINLQKDTNVPNININNYMQNYNTCTVCHKTSCSCQTRYCYICMMRHNILVKCDDDKNSMFSSSIKTVSDLQDQIFRLLDQI